MLQGFLAPVLRCFISCIVWGGCNLREGQNAKDSKPGNISSHTFICNNDLLIAYKQQWTIYSQKS